MLPLRIYGTTSRQTFSRQLRRCVAQQGPTVGIVRPGGKHVGEVITAKRQAFKAWKTGKGTRASTFTRTNGNVSCICDKRLQKSYIV